MENKFNNNFESLVGKLEHFLTTKTVVGEPIHIDNTILVPLVDVSFGVAAGSSASSKFTEKNKEKEKRVDGETDGGAGGVYSKITPSAMLVIQNGTTQLINIKAQDSVSKIIDMVPGILSKVPDLMSKFTHKDAKETDTKEFLAATEEDYHKMNE